MGIWVLRHSKPQILCHHPPDQSVWERRVLWVTPDFRGWMSRAGGCELIRVGL